MRNPGSSERITRYAEWKFEDAMSKQAFIDNKVEKAKESHSARGNNAANATQTMRKKGNGAQKLQQQKK
jgi:prefoldin subunit 5